MALLGGAGLLQSVVGRFLYFTGVRLIGANKTSAIIRTNVLYAVILGIFILNESLTILLFLGIVAIITGVTLVSTEKQGVNEEKQAGPSRIRAKGIAAGCLYPRSHALTQISKLSYFWVQCYSPNIGPRTPDITRNIRY